MSRPRSAGRTTKGALLATAGALLFYYVGGPAQEAGKSTFVRAMKPKQSPTGASTLSRTLSWGGFGAQTLQRAARLPQSAESKDAGRLLPDFTDKVVLVTGASRGIGAAIADAFAAAGAIVVGTATSDSGAEAISARFTDGLKGKGMKLDVVNPDEVDTLVKAVIKEFGGVDILVNNAGITRDTLMLRMKEKDWGAVIDTNLNSIYRMTQAVLKGMTRKRWGRIISISSVVGSMGNAGQANYAAAKAGMEGFTRALAREVGSRGITVNAVAPGFIKSDMTDGLKEEWKAKLLESVPVGRLGQPKEIADAVLFLASPDSSYITGQSLHVNGGMYM